MVDRSQANPRDDAAAAQDALLATKLHVPVIPPDRVPRPRLIALLEQHEHRGLVLVCAPAGYGKTVVLADWVRRGCRKVAWLSLDAGDNDPARFWRHLWAALDRAVPGMAELFGGPPAATSATSFEAPATALINGLAAESGEAEVLLVLDDYHVIEAPRVHQLVDFLLEHRPPNLRLVLSSRSDPPLALARLRARDELTELRVAQLRFTSEEAAALLRQASPDGSDEVADTDFAALLSRTEGWAAGLQLAALSLRGHPDVASFVTSFTGSHRHVLDYLTEEVLERQDPNVRTFLTETAVLDRLSGPLCDAVTGRTEGQAMLEQIERAGLFLIPLDDVRGWWRYHHLFADLLRARLQRDGDRAVDLHRAAADWYTQQGLLDEAIRHNLSAGAKESAARLIEMHFDTVFSLRGEETTIRTWLTALPDGLVRSRPRLLLAQALMAGMRGEADAMASLIDAGEKVSADAEESYEPTAGAAGSLLINVLAVIGLLRSYLAQLRGDADDAAMHTARAMTLMGEHESALRAGAEGFLAMSEWLRGELSRAEHLFASRLDGWRDGPPTTAAWGHYSLARIQRERGELDTSDRTCRQALICAAVPGRPALPAAGPAFVGLAEAAYQRNDLGVAERRLAEGISLCRHFVHTPPLAAGLVTLAWVRQARGDVAGARATMIEAAQVSPGPSGLLNPVPAETARLCLAQGDLETASRWVDDNALRTDETLLYAREPGHLVLARVLLARERPDAALMLLDQLRVRAQNQQRVGSLIWILGLRALALAAAGDSEGGMAALCDALKLAGRRGHVRVFTDEGAPMSTLLGRLSAAVRTGRITLAVPADYLIDVQQSFSADRRDAVPTSVETSALIDPLTARETEILSLIVHGRSNQAIAGELVISIDTVKKHVTHILGKLGATNRTEAAARSRELGLTR